MAKAKILIVEDEALIAKDIQDTLKDFGYDVPAIAMSGEEAIEKAEEVKPDLILMGITLRGSMDGIETAKKIRNCSDVPVIYLTTYMNKERLERAKDTEPFDYIEKPIDEERFLSAVIETAL